VELHGHEIFHAKGAWSDVPPRARVGVFDDVIEAVAAQDVRVIARGLDIVGQQARYSQPDPPHTVVLQHLLERVDESVTSGMCNAGMPLCRVPERGPARQRACRRHCRARASKRRRGV